MSRMPSSLVAPQTPACVVTGTPRSRATSNAAFSGNVGSPVTSKAIWKPSMSSPGVIRRLDEVAELRPRRPLPRPGLDVAVGEHEPARHRAQRVHRGVGVLGGLQPVRPVDRGRHAGVERLDAGEHVAGVDVLRPEGLAVLEVVPDEVLGQRPVGAVAAHRGLPHVPVGVDHARHHDAAGRVDLQGAVRHGQAGSDRLDPLADDEHVGADRTLRLVVHRQHGAAAEHHRAPGSMLSHWSSSAYGAPHARTRRCARSMTRPLGHRQGPRRASGRLPGRRVSAQRTAGYAAPVARRPTPPTSSRRSRAAST